MDQLIKQDTGEAPFLGIFYELSVLGLSSYPSDNQIKLDVAGVAGTALRARNF
jgi:hypothetical protein